ncbi:hypothetical protein HU200_060419 [Digitaria exilis]|uniref:Uncharacterized protein n=1 Tax=Digitaria exilis TaxID=1010633 RepID=A0A835AGQ9_9POAL|nr:hypothetical protein HU200_060419 [Digitaria exilis]
MERSISSLCASLSSVLDHADSSSRELADLVSRRPIHLGNLHTRLSSGPTGTRHLFRDVENRCWWGAHAEVDSEVQDGDIRNPGDPANGCFSVSSSVLKSSRGRFGNDDDAPYPSLWYIICLENQAFREFEESLKSLGFSDACLATLSSEGTQVTDYGEKQQELYKNPESADEGKKIMKEAELIAPQSQILFILIFLLLTEGNSFKEMLRASKEEYEQLPPYMKSLASWEVRLNFWRKGRACLLMLLRLNQLTMEAIDGATFYTLRKNNS